MTKVKEQRLIFVFAMDKDGQIKIDMQFVPKLMEQKTIMEFSSMAHQQLQLLAAAIGQKFMESIHTNAEAAKAEAGMTDQAAEMSAPMAVEDALIEELTAPEEPENVE